MFSPKEVLTVNHEYSTSQYLTVSNNNPNEAIGTSTLNGAIQVLKQAHKLKIIIAGYCQNRLKHKGYIFNSITWQLAITRISKEVICL